MTTVTGGGATGGRAALARGLPLAHLPEPDDRDDVRAAYDAANLKINELLYRRVDLADVVSAHWRALERAPAIGLGR